MNARIPLLVRLEIPSTTTAMLTHFGAVKSAHGAHETVRAMGDAVGVFLCLLAAEDVHGTWADDFGQAFAAASIKTASAIREHVIEECGGRN